MDKKKFKLLLVDDEEDLREILTFNLAGEGYQVSTAANAEEALKMPLEEYHLLILDVMMPGMSGFKLAELIRRDKKLTTPIIFLTAKGTENDLLTGFNIGADDYMAKPFSIKELQARIQAILMRSLQGGLDFEESQIEIGTLLIDLDAKQVFINGEPIDLTKKELEILILLARDPSKVFSREEILDRIWREDVFVMERTIDVHITRIRKKLRGSGIKIINRSGFGYCLVEEEAQ
ncbi:response regulator transcription factor [Porphyromonas asaccharolytica]|uniref:Two component transcriptional regulator, winged helix family n=1 Tax=Porphyromonas asaccharolytica (strain ATCC 25260 / DSM 20707 / BCRC 10618 / CCUG 7834 / JCM 6326 / LMG 13178 / VPI 4198 / B440) TaxID=879243 RepID=F4KM27_PORAD|nr:response regulator transcription factor [Porphyromonas asaccharolytica]AEE13193.1 two component transcriptional regulator, winged helix family [Porphyromonas asaccharolytica DSM 20707]